MTFSFDAVKLVSKNAMLEEVVRPTSMQYAFTMCNPPFFESERERLGGLGDRPAPATFCSGTEEETVTEGGEVGFVKKMIQESMELKGRVRQV